MARTRQFRAAPLQVVCTEEMRAKIDKIAEEEGVSAASVIRDALEGHGLQGRLEVHNRRMEARTA